jgi:hypothetical protein
VSIRVFGGIYWRNYRVNVVWGDLRDEGVWGLGLLRSGIEGEGITHYGGIGCLLWWWGPQGLLPT